MLVATQRCMKNEYPYLVIYPYIDQQGAFTRIVLFPDGVAKVEVSSNGGYRDPVLDPGRYSIVQSERVVQLLEDTRSFFERGRRCPNSQTAMQVWQRLELHSLAGVLESIDSPCYTRHNDMVTKAFVEQAVRLAYEMLRPFLPIESPLNAETTRPS